MPPRSVAPLTILAAARKVPYDPFQDLLPVTRHADATGVIAIHPSVPANTLQEFVALAKQNPGKFTFGSSGLGTLTQMICESLNQAAGIEMLHVPYRGGAESLNDFLAGVVQVFSEGNVMPHAKAGKAKLLAVVDAARHPEFPDVPMVTEIYPSMDIINWFGIFAPAGTPDAVVRRMAAAFNQAGEDAALQAHFIRMALRVNPKGSPEDLAAILRKDHERYGAMVRKLNIRME